MKKVLIFYCLIFSLFGCTVDTSSNSIIVPEMVFVKGGTVVGSKQLMGKNFQMILEFLFLKELLH